MSEDGNAQRVTANERLSVFVGKWHTTGDVFGDDDEVVSRIDAIDIYEWQPGNYALMHYTDSTIGDEEIQGVEIIGYDAARQVYFGAFFDDHGSVGAEDIRIDGNSWIWQGRDVMGVKHHRCTVVFRDEETMTGRHERSDDGEQWRAWMDVTLRRIG